MVILNVETRPIIYSLIIVQKDIAECIKEFPRQANKLIESVGCCIDVVNIQIPGDEIMELWNYKEVEQVLKEYREGGESWLTK